MKRMLFNATQQEELRVAIVDGQKLIDIDIETTGREQRKSNIYKGVITRIEPSLEACFVNYGEERHGFLPFKEVARSYFKDGVDVRNATIKEALREGQEIMVQVEKEERGNKGAALTSFISLAGRYLVLMPNNPRGGGVSRRVEGEDRQELREAMDKLDLPSGMSVIARTAGIGRSVEELQWDLNYLMQLWRAIENAGQSAPGAFLIYQESSLVIRAIRDYFQPDIGEILIDTDDIYEQAQQFMSHVMPDMVHRVKRYRDDVPLFSRFQIEHQIETAYSRTVPLPSGGAIVIDHTEALVSVDVNSARATRGSDIETTAFNTNLEAADEVARQLRLRDLGGLIVIDFIDMETARNQREVETRLKDALHYDRARVQMGKISRFGLMELSRQRLRPSLSEGSHVTCPRCNGTGHIRDTESSALQVLRIIQEEAMKENSAAIHVQAPVDVAAFLLNEKRGEILKIETRHRVSVILIPNKHLETPHYKLERIKHDDPRLEDMQASYDMAEEANTDMPYGKRQKEDVRPRQEAVVKSITPEQAPIVERRQPQPMPETVVTVREEGFLSRLFGLFRKKPVLPPAPAAPAAAEKPQAARERGERNNRGGAQRGRTRNGRTQRDRDERETAKPEAREEAARPATTAAAPAQPARAPRQPREGREPRENRETREPRENREVREPREPRQAREPAETRETQPREAAEGRRERAPRAPREERKETVEAEKEELLAKAPAQPAAPIPVEASTAAADAGSEETVAALPGESQEDGEEQPRRRRRRGGRSRSRRETDAVDAGEAGSAAPAGAAVLTEGIDAALETQAGQAAPAAQPESAPAPQAALASAGPGLPVAPEAPAQAILGTEEAAPAPTPLPVEPAGTTPAEPAFAEAVEAEPVTAQGDAAQPEAVQAEPAEPAQNAAVQAEVEQPKAAETTEGEPVQAQAEAVQPEVAQPEVAEPAQPATAQQPDAAGTVAPQAEPAHATASQQESVEQQEVQREVSAPAAPAPAAMPAASMPVDELTELLKAAGLSLASTDPEKLRASQEASAKIVPPPRVPRQRKPLPPVSSEPLIQVETHR